MHLIPHRYFVLIVAKCNVNFRYGQFFIFKLQVLIVAKCNVNILACMEFHISDSVLIVAKCNVNLGIYQIKCRHEDGINSSKV